MSRLGCLGCISRRLPSRLRLSASSPRTGLRTWRRRLCRTENLIDRRRLTWSLLALGLCGTAHGYDSRSRSWLTGCGTAAATEIDHSSGHYGCLASLRACLGRIEQRDHFTPRAIFQDHLVLGNIHDGIALVDIPDPLGFAAS